MIFRLKEKRHNKAVRFDELMPRILHDFQMEDKYCINWIQARWSSIVGELIATHTVPVSINKSVLNITADHSLFSTEVLMYAHKIKEMVKNEFGFEAVRYMRVKVKKM